MSSRPPALNDIPQRTHLAKPRGHAVHFYESDRVLMDALGEVFGPALLVGDTGIVVATEDHRRELETMLGMRGVDVAAARLSGRYLELDAEAALAAIMADGSPDQRHFEATIGTLIAGAEAAAGGGRVVVFGEMVALLWNQGKHEATVRLEQLWNNLSTRHSFYLLCGYPLEDFDRTQHQQMFFNICGEHTEVNPAEANPRRGSERRGRRRARVQQKSRGFEEEIRASQERVLMMQLANGAGAWEFDVVGDTLSLSSAAARLLRMPSGRVPLNWFLDQMYYSGDRDAVSAALKQSQHGRKTFAVGFRVHQRERIRLLQICGKTFYNSGSPIVLGVLLDVTPPQIN
jgi:DcmR-like sensory protein